MLPLLKKDTSGKFDSGGNLPPVSTTPAVPKGKLTAGVVDTGGKLANGVIDTGGTLDLEYLRECSIKIEMTLKLFPWGLGADAS